MVIALQAWVWCVVTVMTIYAIRHWTFTWSRLTFKQRPFYQDLFERDLPPLTVLIPMHNEGQVARAILDALLASDYPRDRLEIIPIDDQSRDETTAIIHEYSQEHDFIKPIFSLTGDRGKPLALNRALTLATHEIVLVFDADYTPGKGLLRELAMAFVDPQVAAVMGRVIPRNTSDNLLTRLLSLERSGGYQVDQQARYNFDLLPQYGGTVGGFRKSVILDMGGFDTMTLAEDTDLTARLYVAGWAVSYANHAECYEELPTTWDARFRQLRRWARGHNRTLVMHLGDILHSRFLNGWQKMDGALLLFVYIVPPILLSGMVANALLFYMGSIPVIPSLLFAFFVVSYNAFGNFGPVFEIGAAELLDGARERIYLLPYLFYLFLFNTWAVTVGALDAFGDIVKSRRAGWDKTKRRNTNDNALV